MPENLDLRYRAAESDQERASAVFSGAILVYRSLSAMHDLVRCLREITLREFALSDPVSAEAVLGPNEFRRRAGRARQVVRDSAEVSSLYKTVLMEAGVDVSALFYDHFKLRFQPSKAQMKSRYMCDLPPHRDTWGSNIYAQINWWAPVWPVTVDRTIGMFPSRWHLPVSNSSAEWRYSELMEQIRGDRSTEYPMLPQCTSPPSPAEVVPVVIQPGDLMAFSGAHLHCSMPNHSGLVRISTETRTVSAHDLLDSREAKNVDCSASVSHFDWFRHIETGVSLADHL